MPKRKIKKPVKDISNEENFELDLDVLTDQLANTAYNENTDANEKELRKKTSVDVPERYMNKILIDVTTNKIKKTGPTTNSEIINEAIKFYYDSKEGK